MLAALFSNIASLSRYDGWFLIPFVTLYVLIAAKRRRVGYAILFGALASLGPLYWLAHNWYCCGNMLAFYNGPGSAKAIYQAFLDKGMARYRGDHNWRDAWLYFRTAAQLCLGWPLIVIGLCGIAAALFKRAVWPIVFLALAPVFYVLSVYSSGLPIFVPQLWPHSWYNTRYGLAVLPGLALAGGALAALVPAKLRPFVAVLIVAAGISPWLAYPNREAWICWKESQVNSDARRDWTHQAAEFLAARYQRGTPTCGVLREKSTRK